MSDLTIVTIGFKNNDDLSLTMKSIESVLSDRVLSLVKDGGGTFIQKECPSSKLVFKKDLGIFDGINQGLALVRTKYVMLIHSGDELLLSKKELMDIIDRMEQNCYDLCLGSQFIDYGGYNRYHGVGLWRPWHLWFGSQPPHLPTIYRSDFISNISYNVNNTVIGDYEYFQELFSRNPRFTKYLEKAIIRMGPGGNTTSGLKSLVLVSKEHLKQSGWLFGSVKVLFRFPLKIISLFY
jgi:hypothetical protein